MSELETKALSVGYENSPLIQDISLQVKAGKIVVLIGPNGAGKSTILKTVAGNLSPVGGVVYLNKIPSDEIPAKERAKEISVMMTQRTNTEYATCFDVVSVGRYPFTGITGKLSQADIDAVKEAMEMVRAEKLRDRDFMKISDGQKQRVLLARALAQNPGVMVLDEPTGFLDIGYKLEFLELLRKLAKEKQIGILISMHELELAKVLADTVVCVSAEGRIDRIGAPEEVFSNDYLEFLFSIPKGMLKKVYPYL